MALLLADRTQLVEGIRVLDGMIKRKRQANAVFTFTDGQLSISVANTVVTVQASGEWTGTARISALMLFAAITPPPTDDLVRLTVDKDRMIIDRRSIRCDWVESKHRR